MLGTLLRSKFERAPRKVEQHADESTQFLLSTAVPRPVERRTEERLLATLPAAKLVTRGFSQLCRIRNISAGGLTAEVIAPHEVGTELQIELDSEHRIPGTVVWTREGLAGVKFNESFDVRALFSERTQPAEQQKRPPRVEVSCAATIRIGNLYHKVEVRDISLGGMKVELQDPTCVGREVTVSVESLRPVCGTVGWYRDGHAGIVFDEAFGFAELAQWLAKRIDIASLRTRDREQRP